MYVIFEVCFHMKSMSYSSNIIGKTQIEYCLSKFEWSVIINLLQISLFFGVYTK